MIAPLRAIGLPSADSSVMLGGAIGWSERDSGAVTASHANSSMKTINSPSAMRLAILRRRGQRLCGGGGSGGTAPGTGLIKSSVNGGAGGADSVTIRLYYMNNTD